MEIWTEMELVTCPYCDIRGDEGKLMHANDQGYFCAECGNEWKNSGDLQRSINVVGKERKAYKDKSERQKVIESENKVILKRIAKMRYEHSRK